MSTEFEKKLHKVEINFGLPGDFFLKIDGKEFDATCGVTIKSPMASGVHYPIVTVSFYAKVKGTAKECIVEETRET